MVLQETFTHPYLKGITVEVFKQDFGENLSGKITKLSIPNTKNYTPEELSSIANFFSQTGGRIADKYKKTGNYRRTHNSSDPKTNLFGRTQPH